MGKFTDRLADSAFADMFHDAYVERDEAKMKTCLEVIQAFIAKPGAIAKKKIQAVAVSTDLVNSYGNAIDVITGAPNFDMGWEQAFKNITLMPGQDFWEIYDVTNGVTIKKIKEGGRVKIDKFEGASTLAYVDYYGGALGYTDKVVRFRKIQQMIDKAELFRNTYWVNKSNNHYVLLATAAALNPLAWQGTGTNTLTRDIATINRAAFNILNRVKDKGYDPNIAGAQLLLYYNPLDASRMLAALAATTAMLAQQGITGAAVNFNVKPVQTFNQYIVSGHPIMVLPGHKIQKAEAMSLTDFPMPKDPFTLNEAVAFWAIYGAAVADTDQCERLSLA